MRVEVDDCDRSVGPVHAAEQGKGNGVVAAKSDDSWEGFAVLRGPDFLRIGCWLTHENAVVAFFNLLDGPFVVIATSDQHASPTLTGQKYGGLRSHWDVSAIDDPRPVVERVCS